MNNKLNKLNKLSKILLTSIPLLCGLNSNVFAIAELENIRFVNDNIIQINTNETLKKMPDSFILNDTNPSKIIFDFIDVDFKKELKQKLSKSKNLQIVKDDNTNKTRLVITLKDNEKVNYKTELYRNGIQITLSPINEYNKNFDTKINKMPTQTQMQNNVVADDVDVPQIKRFDHIIYSKTNNVINFNFLNTNIDVNSHKDEVTDSLIIELLNTTLSKKSKNLLMKNLVSYNKNNAFNMKFVEDKNTNTLKFIIKHKGKNKNQNTSWDYNLSQTNKMLTLQLFENDEEPNSNNDKNAASNAKNSKKNNQNLVENNAEETANNITNKNFCEQIHSVSKSAGNIVLTNLNAQDINNLILSNKCQEKNINNVINNHKNNVVLIGNSYENLLDNLAKQHKAENTDIPTISNDFIQPNDSIEIDKVKTINVTSSEIVPLTLDFLVLQKNIANNELVKMPKIATKHDYKNIEKTDLNNTIIDFKKAKLSLEVIPKIISKNKTNLQINLRQNSSAANNMNETTISTNTNAYVDNNGTLSIAVLSAEAENNQILILIKPKINYVDSN